MACFASFTPGAAANNQVPLNHVTTPNSPLPASSDLLFPSKMSQLFNRDTNSFPRSLLPPHQSNRPEGIEIWGPCLTWRSPRESHRLGGGFCYSNRVAAPPRSIRCPHTFPPEHTRSYIGIVSLTFKASRAPELDDRVTKAGLVGRVSELALSQKACIDLHVLSPLVTPQNVDLIIGMTTATILRILFAIHTVVFIQSGIRRTAPRPLAIRPPSHRYRSAHAASGRNFFSAAAATLPSPIRMGVRRSGGFHTLHRRLRDRSALFRILPLAFRGVSTQNFLLVSFYHPRRFAESTETRVQDSE